VVKKKKEEHQKAIKEQGVAKTAGIMENLCEQ